MKILWTPKLTAFLFVFGIIGNSSLNAQFMTTGLLPGSTAATGVMFDIQAHKNLSITSLSIQVCNVVPCGLVDLEVWTTVDGASYAGRESDSHAWVLLKTVQGVTPLGLNTWTPLNLGLDVFMRVGEKRGFYIVRANQGGVIFGHPTASPGPVYSSNVDMSVFTGIGNYYFQPSGSMMASIIAHYTVAGSFVSDLRMHRIISPVVDPLLCTETSSTEILSAELLNLGNNPIPIGTIIPMTFQVDNGVPITEFYAVNLAIPPNGTFQFSFSAPLDLSGIGSHSVTVTHMFLGDQNGINDSIVEDFSSGGTLQVAHYPWRETFDDQNSVNQIIPPVGWTQESADSSGWHSEWEFHNYAQGFISRPSFDHTSGVSQVGFYASTNDVSSHAAVSLRSPCFDLTGLASPRVGFWIFSRNLSTQGNELFVDVYDEQLGLVIGAVHGPIGALTNMWHPQTLDLSAFAGKTIRLIFRGTTTNLGTTQNVHDIAIDDIYVFDSILPIGQTSRTGIAAFDLGGARNGNWIGVGPGVKGPFFSIVSANEPAVLEFSGQPNMPVALLNGVLNPLAATFPNVGALDMGGAIDPFTGIPAGIVILADGNVPSGVGSLFNTGPAGSNSVMVVVPNVPPGTLGAFQCLIRKNGPGGAGVALSNAVEVFVD